MKFENLKDAQDAYDKLAVKLEASEKENSEALQTIDALNAEASAAAKEKKVLEKQVKDLSKAGKELSETLKAVRADKSGSKEITFDFEDKTYKITAKSFSYEGKVITAEELCEDKKLQEKMISDGVGFIEEIAE